MNRFISITAIIISVAAITMLLLRPSPKAAYINNAELYNEFTLKKELETKLNNTKSVRKNILDSMMLRLQMQSRELEANEVKFSDLRVKEFEMARQEYLVKEQQFNEDNERIAQQYTDQIWKQLNQYVQDYAKENGYAFIYGAIGDGSLMYGDDQYNITKEVSEYVNRKYNGGDAKK